MRIWPVFFDVVPRYLGPSGGSLLQTPLGTERLVSCLCARVRTVTPNAPVILPPLRSGPSYRAALRAACPAATVLADGDALVDALPSLESSDVFLFVDARCFPVDGGGLAALEAAFSAGRPIAHHLVAVAASHAGSREHVQTDGAGRVRSIHRYYAPMAPAPTLAGVAASLVPVASSLLALAHVPESGAALRRRLAACGAPSRDVALEGVALDLTTRHGVLAAMEHGVVEAADRARAAGGAGPVLVGDGHVIAPTARLLGPVVLHAHVRIGAHATIVGPALLGAGAQVASGGVVAHALVGPQAQVPPGRTLRDCVWYNDIDHRSQGPRRASYRARLERLGVSPDATRAIDGGAAVPPRWPLRWKRLVDAVAAAVGLALLAPVFLLIAVLIRVGSRGPIFYRGEREGVGARPFRCLKFRTMRVGAHEVQHLLKAQDKLDGPHFKLDGDPRVTRLGRLLRATNLDELPQLINVLRGDMSLVGPRPSPFRENQICAPWREGRLSVRPGLTGLWQVCRRDRASGDFHQWIEYDLLYVQQASPLLDLKILIATVLTLVGRVHVPVAWLVRGPDGARPAGVVGFGRKPARPLQPHAAVAGPARPSLRNG
jgi:lipopolysaccharide/colanic/teichoic acid biosynthesis glycosyltransferase